MMICTVITALTICSAGWISVSGSESQTVEAQPGQDVTLQSTNMSKYDSVTHWYRMVNRTKISCISTMFKCHSKASYCDGFQNGKFKMRSNISTIFLDIMEVNLSDSGLYLCGFYTDGKTIFSVTRLNVTDSEEFHDDDVDKCGQQKDCRAITKVTSVILGVAAALLIVVIIGLVVKNRKLQRAAKEEQEPQQYENQASDYLNYAAVTFSQQRRPREVEEDEEEDDPSIKGR